MTVTSLTIAGLLVIVFLAHTIRSGAFSRLWVAMSKG